MKKLLLFTLLLLPVLSSAQIPTEYSETEINALRTRINALRDTYDYVIPIIERLPVQPTSYSVQASGNWGSEWTGANKFEQEVFNRATRPVVVFIFDTSPAWTHTLLLNFAWNDEGRSWTNEPELKDGNGHGTHVAGIVGAQSSNYNLGIARALVKKGLLKGIPYEVLNDSGSGFFSWTADATRAATERAKELQRQGYFVVFNYSLGGTNTHTPTQDAIKAAEQAGIFICAAAGNTSNQGVQFPGRADGANAIASINADGRRSSFSSYGEQMYMGAPGRGILSTYLDDRLVELSGTSMASPTQAGLVSIAASVHPNLNAAQIKAMLIEIATDIDPAGFDPETGYGYDYIGKILNYDSGNPPPPDDEPEPPTKSTRVIEVTLPGVYQSMYQRQGGKFYDFYVSDLQLKFRTNLYAEDGAKALSDFVESYFAGRAFILQDDSDFLDAGYWAGKFMEMVARESEIKIWVDDMTVISSDGYVGKPSRPFLPVFTPRASQIIYGHNK